MSPIAAPTHHTRIKNDVIAGRELVQPVHCPLEHGAVHYARNVAPPQDGHAAPRLKR